jgi:hypothetical protein
VRNDIAFIINNRLVIIEHQLRINKNAPFRMLAYLSCIYEEITEGSLRIKYEPLLLRIMANTEFIVLYCGEEDYPAESILNLSDMFMKIDEKERSAMDELLFLELKVVVLNINKGFNPKLERRSKTLADYAALITKFRKYRAQNRMEEIEQYIRDSDILKVYVMQKLTDMMMEEVRIEKELDEMLNEED